MVVWKSLTMRTVGPLALNDRFRTLSRAAASLWPGLAERLGLRPEVTSDASRNPVQLSPEQTTRQVLQQFMPTHPQFVPTFLSPAGTAGRFLLSRNAQMSCQIEGNSEYLCINERAGIQSHNLDSRLRGNDGTRKSSVDDALRRKEVVQTRALTTAPRSASCWSRTEIA
jgi:hypothetical protein